MHTRFRSIAIFLLAVFAAGGLLSPLAHRISHVHALEHEHGQAAAHFSVSHASDAEFFVEERTPPHELVCDLCARLTLASISEGETSLDHLNPTSLVRIGEDRPSGLAFTLSRIRAPPVLS